MKLLCKLTLLAAALALSACGGRDTASRGGAIEQMSVAPAVLEGETDLASLQLRRPAYDVRGITVSVPQSLSVSEANIFYPVADIVWRGDPRGDRHAQVQAIFESALGLATANMHSGPAVWVDIEVRRFHALTEKTRYTVGGINAIDFTMTIRDAATGQPVQTPRKINADFRAIGGTAAIEAEAHGRTEKVLILDHLRGVFLRELSVPVTPGTIPGGVTTAVPVSALPASALPASALPASALPADPVAAAPVPLPVGAPNAVPPARPVL